MNIRLRNDLLYFPRESGFEPTWVIKDPLTFEHYLFSQREYFLLNQIDGSQSEEDILLRWRDKFKTRSLSINQLRQFIRRLIQDKLVVVDQLGYGDSIYRRQVLQRRRSRTGLLINPLAIRFRGFNPAGLLRHLDWLGRLLFHPLTVAVSLIFSLTILLYMFGHFEDVAGRIPAIEQFLTAGGLIGLIVTIAIVKVIHEFGHALACRRYGGECFEIGVILLAFIPTMYCNVSDAWTFPRRWQRIMVSFAGIYLEICLAAVAAVLWLATPPSFGNALLFNVVLLCSVNTLLINGNPLLRYDGYYMLADWWNKPNLGSAANLATTKFWLSWFREPVQPIATSTGVLIYGLLSSVYRWFILLAILAGIVWVIGQAGSYPLGYLFSGFLLAGFVMTAIGRNVAIARGSQWRGASAVRLMCTLVILVGIAWFLFFVPLPCSVYCGVAVEATDPVRIYASQAGRIEFVEKNYAAVTAGQTIASIKNQLLKRRLQVKQNELKKYEDQLRELQLRVNQDPGLAASINTVRQKRNTLRDEIELVNEEINGLTMKSPVAGIVYPAVAKPRHWIDEPTTQRWEGFINDPKNIGCVVSRGEHLLSVSEVDQPTVSLIVGEGDVEWVEIGQSVKIRFEQLPNTPIYGEVIKIQRQDLPVKESDLNFQVESYLDSQGNQKLVQTPYRVEVGNTEIPSQVFPGSTGRGKISVRQQTLVQRLWHMIKTSFAKRGSP